MQPRDSVRTMARANRERFWGRWLSTKQTEKVEILF